MSVTRDEPVVHTYPVNDVVAHDTENFDECICGPDVEYVGPGWHVLHHSLDGREQHEDDDGD